MNVIEKYDYFIFDLDGTIYRGEHLIPNADKVVNHLKLLNKKVVFVSNKTTGTALDYYALLKNWGLNIVEDQIINSTIVASNYLKKNFNGETFFAIGEDSFKNEIENEIKIIDNFTLPGDWKQPDYSGSTSGILASGTHLEFTNLVYLPATNPKKSAKLTYLWNENASTFLIREYLNGGTPQSIYFDTSYVLQSYIYGDGSNTRFRFCIDEYTGTAWGDHEVSKWVTIDWYGWKLVEWKLNDPNSVGIWIGDGNLTGQYFRIDSYQLTKTAESLISGVIYFDDLRAVKKVNAPTDIMEDFNTIPEQYLLSQNYPNPFNPSTIISWQSPVSGHQTLKVYDVLGNEVATLVDEYKPAGRYQVEFNGPSDEGQNLSSGIYFYRLEAGSFVETRKMIYLK